MRLGNKNKIELVILVFIALLINSSSAISQPVRLTCFNELFTALNEGRDVRTVIHYAKCRLFTEGIEKPAPDVTGGMNLNSFEYFAKGTVNNTKGFIAISETVLISHKFYDHVLNYVKMRIYDDNTVEIVVQYLNPVTYKVVMDESFYSFISNDKNEGAVFFFVN